MSSRPSRLWLATVLIITASLFCSREKIINPQDTIYGSWVRRITDTQNQQFDAELKINTNNTFDFILLQNVPGHNNSTGQFTLTDDIFTVINDADCGVDGVYQYVVSDEKLAFIVVTDACAPRQLVLQGVWTKR